MVSTSYSARMWRFLIGPPLKTVDIPHQVVSKVVGLAVFASDALSSTAYATEEILVILALAGAGVFHLSVPIALAIAALLLIVSVSYRQTIYAYPNGGGAYIVARDNLGELMAQTAGAALLTDYILTVAVSISSGVAQIASALPFLLPFRVELAVVLIVFMTIVNLRGVKESGRLFAVPTYFFIVMMAIALGAGIFRLLSGSLQPVSGVEILHDTVQPLTWFLVLRAFSSGCAALTGIEAISNGITAFREPKSRNAAITLIWMSSLLVAMFVGLTVIAHHVQALPSETETVVSQVGRAVLGRGLGYMLLMVSAMAILIMAANTSFADFPRLAALHAGDGFLPRQLTYRGSRLVFSHGILTLSGTAVVLVVLFGADVSRLIPLYAIGVFLSFTVSQAGMVVRWQKIGHLKPGERVETHSSVLEYDRHWRLKQVLSGMGALATGIVMIVFAVTKFSHGAWVIVVIVPALVSVFFAIHYHYKATAAQLSMTNCTVPPPIRRHRVIVPIASVHRGVMQALRYAQSISDDVTAVYVELDPAETLKVRARWREYGDGVRLVVLPSPYRQLVEPLVEYVDKISQAAPGYNMITLVLPQFVPDRWWHNFLHNQTAYMIHLAFLFRRNTVVVHVPYQLDTTRGNAL
ncbi:MAG: APC family permease [Thermoflexales bacterium]|nr:APC family permease [Thermoflexales bacterium]